MMSRDGAACGQPASVVDHIIPHRGDQAKFWDSANWQSLCTRCHSSRKQAMEPRASAAAQKRSLPFDIKRSRIPVTMVCGPPGSGKSTYVRQNAGPNDLIIDLDVIRSRLSSQPIHSPAAHATRAALEERNRLLRSLASDHDHDKAWFIISAPNAAERAMWRDKLGATVVLLAVPIEECRRRIWSDPERVGQCQRMEDLARRWWSRFTREGAIAS
jgi:predicted kinase